MFRQYLAAKADHRDALLFFRMGDFYEMFYEDALIASKALEVTLTTRGRGTASEAPMCGVPAQAVEGYVARLVRMGHRVAICDQMEDPKTAKGLVSREVTRVVSPGTLIDPGSLEPRQALYVASMQVHPDGRTGLALADLSTGAFLAWEGEALRAREVLAAYGPREVIHPESRRPDVGLGSSSGPPPLLSPRPGWTFALRQARETLMRHFSVATLDGFGLSDRPAATAAAGALLGFLQESQRKALDHVESVKLIDTASCLVLDQTTRRNLEVLRSMGDDSDRPTLFGVLDLTRTAMGGRLLREYLLRPLLDAPEIDRRLDAVAELLEKRAAREALREILRPVPDLERLLGRVALGTANARDLLGIRACLEAFGPLRECLSGFSARLLLASAQLIHESRELASRLARAIADDAPASLAEGGVIRDGFDPDVDRWRQAQRTARSTLAQLELRERRRSGISNLKVRHNSVFGYYIEVSRSQLGAVPDDYIRRQTLVGAERFVTAELKEFEEDVLKAETRLSDRERELFRGIVDEVAAEGSELRSSAQALATVDVLASFAEASERHGYSRPSIKDHAALRIIGGRHPVVERLASGERFIPNDLWLDADSSQVVVLTGPNMGGKSTYLRQAALIVLMAQAGCFVPAESAEIGIVDRIFCRAGASDNLSGGQSTFLVEMSETANILLSATSRSLVLLDEIGRGTSTFDGLSIAWAVAEWLHENPAVRPRALFATHYHEMTELASLLARVRNLHMSAKEHQDTVLFLRKVEEGPADRSYGIQVARLAGMPREIIARAREILHNLESSEFGKDGVPSLARRGEGGAGDSGARPPRAGGLPPSAALLLEELDDLDPDHLKPIDALSLIARWKQIAQSDPER